MVLQGAPDHYWDVPDDGRALYVHKLVARADLRGSGLGADCLAWGEARARAAGKTWMRLDCSAANPKLCEYYPRHGYRALGEVYSERFQIRMALFEKDL
jgi:GNAT superfamily N-acetyltransferase